jgi:hypothetical protein
MTESTLCFLDTETTSLHSHRKTWNIATILRDPDGHETAEEIIIRADDLIWEADPMALVIGHFWERHPDFGGDPGDALVLDEDDAVKWLHERIRPVVTPQGAVPMHIVAAVPSFDVEGLSRWFRQHQLPWPMHYHQICAENVAVGALAARGLAIRPPYKSEDLSKLLGLDMSSYSRHTALGDATWARDLYDAAMRPIPVGTPMVTPDAPAHGKGLIDKVLGRA